ncbi:hypothetical protein H920_06071 [Fukomys damarensis]|uniref:Uncharacterized protein n=1 Tax=Fukomys damarensis TaxID=885580 RepID=A0A091DQF9_FUKDA|nr:hypothetical protein H920_06071 [Fukomys damarensis]
MKKGWYGEPLWFGTCWQDSDVAARDKWRPKRDLSKRDVEESALRSRALQQEPRLIPAAPAGGNCKKGHFSEKSGVWKARESETEERLLFLNVTSESRMSSLSTGSAALGEGGFRGSLLGSRGDSVVPLECW